MNVKKLLTGIIVIAAVALTVVAIKNYRAGAPSPFTSNANLLRREAVLAVNAADVAYFGSAKGYYVRPKQSGVYPGVVMVHEWWGLNDYIKQMARQLAGEGYAVLAVDLYNGEVATDAARARELVTSLNQDEAVQNMRAAAAFLRSEGTPKIAALGWCFGGGQALGASLSGEKFDATVIYYGQLTSDAAKLSAISWPVIGIFGDKDTSIPVQSVETFRAALEDLDIQNEIYIYPGVGHAFANPSGANYAPRETMDAWQKTLIFLKTNLAK